MSTTLQRTYGIGRNIENIRRELGFDGSNLISYKTIAEKAGVSTPLVLNTMRGIENNKKVLNVLLELGVSENTLYPVNKPSKE